MEYIEEYLAEYKTFILSYSKNPSEETLYRCSEFGKQLAVNKFTVEELVSLHQTALNDLGDALSHKEMVTSFDLLTEVTVQQTLWLKREIELKVNAQNKITQQLLLERSIISSFPDILIKLTNDLHISDVNQHFERIFPDIPLITKTDLFALFESKSILPDLVKFIRHTGIRSSVKTMVGKNSEQPKECEVTLVLLKDTEGNNDGFLCIIRDLSEQIKTTAKLALANHMIQDVIEAMPLRIFWKDKKLRYLGCNQAYLDDVGLQDERQLLNKTSASVFDSPSPFNGPEALEEKVINQSISHAEHERSIMTADGTSRFIKQTLHPLKDLTGNIYGIICSYEDISELKNKERENQVLADRLNQTERLESIGRLAGGIAHDFNNMLAVILGYAQLMERDQTFFFKPEKAKDYVGRIVGAADKAKLLTEKLLTFSRKQVLQLAPLELSAHVKQTLTTCASIIGEDVFISFHTEGRYIINADRSQIDQVLLNLLVNAHDAMSGKSSLEQKRIDINISSSPHSNHVRLSVKDRGTGIAEALKNKIFEPFFTTKDGAGTGLGLASVHGIILQNNAEITVNSVEGEGAEFIVLWPLCNDKLIPEKESSAKNDSNATQLAAPNYRYTICVVEDEKSVRDLMTSIISDTGHDVYGFDSGEALYEYLNKTHIVPDLLVTDVILAGRENGKQVGETFTQLFPKSRIIFVSGYSNELLSNRGIILEDIVYLTKPFDVDQFKKVVKDNLVSEVQRKTKSESNHSAHN